MDAFGITKTDLISTAICTAGSYFTNEPLGMTAVTQLGSILIAKQVSPMGPMIPSIGPVSQTDFYTGATRATIQKFGLKSSFQNAGIAGVKSIASNVVAKYITPTLESAMAPATPVSESGL